MKTFGDAISEVNRNDFISSRYPDKIASLFEKEIPIYVDYAHSSQPDEEETAQYPVEPYMVGCSAVDGFCPPNRLKMDDQADVVRCDLDEEETNLVPQEISETTLQRYLEEVEFYLKHDLFTDAENLTEKLLLGNPNHPVLLDKLSLIMNHKKNLKTHISTVSPREIYSAFKSLEIVYLKRGIHLWKRGNIDSAMKEFESALSFETNTVFCHKMLAICYAMKGRIVDAIDHFKLGLHCENITRKEQIFLYFKIGRCYEYLREGDEALYYYSKVMRQCPDYRDVRNRIQTLKQT